MLVEKPSAGDSDTYKQLYKQWKQDTKEQNNMTSHTHKTVINGKYRVTGYDSFSRDGWDSGFFDTEENAREYAKENAGSMTLYYVWNDKGEQIAKFGTY